MKPRRTETNPPALRDVFARRSQHLEAFVERERRANQAHWDLIEDAKLTPARLALFGWAPK